jgi:hypothetical protein
MTRLREKRRARGSKIRCGAGVHALQNLPDILGDLI